MLNGTEPWLRIDNTPDQPSPALDFDSMLGNGFPGYIKTEYTYDDSGFATTTTTTTALIDSNVKDELGCGGGQVGMEQQQQLPQDPQQQQQLLTQTIIITNENGELESPGMTAFQDNNNDWHMVDHNSIQTVIAVDQIAVAYMQALFKHHVFFAKQSLSCYLVIF